MKELSDQERGKIKRALLLLESEDKIPSHYLNMYVMVFMSFG